VKTADQCCPLVNHVEYMFTRLRSSSVKTADQCCPLVNHTEERQREDDSDCSQRDTRRADTRGQERTTDCHVTHQGQHWIAEWSSTRAARNGRQIAT